MPSHRPLRAAAAAVAVAIAWLMFAPAAIGGQAAYVIVDGSSMEPGMRRGDLAILRRTDSYAVGDVATYRHPRIGPVIHRIIALEGPRFIFQGDNNDFVDSYRPGAGELLGRLWIHIPRAGALLQLLRQPPVFAALAALVLGSALMAPAPSQLRPRRRRAHAPATALGRPTHDALALLNGLLTGCLALGLAALALAAVSFSRPATRAVAAELTYTQRGRFDYSAAAPAGLYDDVAARAGDPIFLQVSDRVPVTFTYSLATDAPAELAGVARLDLLLSDGAGWRRTLPLGGPTPFTGAEASVAGAIDLGAVRAALASYEALSGAQRGQYHVDLAPTVDLSGALAGAPFATSYSPRLSFTLDAAALRPAGRDAATLAPEAAGALSYQREAPATLSLGPLQLEVAAARRLALAGIEVAVVGGLLAGWRLARAVGRDEDLAFRVRHGHLLVRAASGEGWTAGAVALVGPEELARLAQRLGQPILAVEEGPGAGYYVRDGASVYTCRAEGDRRGGAPA